MTRFLSQPDIQWTVERKGSGTDNVHVGRRENSCWAGEHIL